jgi:hypothetical protein
VQQLYIAVDAHPHSERGIRCVSAWVLQRVLQREPPGYPTHSERESIRGAAALYSDERERESIRGAAALYSDERERGRVSAVQQLYIAMRERERERVSAVQQLYIAMRERGSRPGPRGYPRPVTINHGLYYGEQILRSVIYITVVNIMTKHICNQSTHYKHM